MKITLNRNALTVAVVFALLSPLTFAQNGDYVAPRTIDGQPDLQGVWANNSTTPLQRPEFFADREELTEEEYERLLERAREIEQGDGDALFGDGFLNAAITGQVESYDPSTGNYDQTWMVNRNIENRTSLIIDPPNGRLPDMVPEARDRMMAVARQRRENPSDSYTSRPLQERCITYGMPYLLAGYNSYYQVVQSATHVAIIQEMIHDVRIIPLDAGPHIDDKVRLWHGDSRGYFDGDTLVVETRNFSDASEFRGSGGNRIFKERFTRTAPDILTYEFTIEDPTTWVAPWTAVINYTHSEDPIYEYACHEGNYALEGILSGARAEERMAAEQGNR
ncbi:MAG: hypothetical protein Q8L60_16810 [Gammaproteobacteria bacterium]|nr:hypothetical protein [Gammaproteobacteria bacterium]MDP2140669.1 hypothetical protein [Gammaproteobacteria bacterium]MDP2346928.1 hypothetical protein [Gammaproteobacteria bacterium]